MHFHIYVNDKLGQELDTLAKITGKKRNKIVSEAIEEWVKSRRKKSWPKEIADFQGIGSIPPSFSFEQSRSELIQPKDNIF